MRIPAANPASDRDDPAPRARLEPLLLAVLLWAPMVFLRDAWPLDETRYADVALAMHEGGEWCVPQLHQKWYPEKGPGFFWAAAGLARLGVPIERAPLLVSLISALACVALLPGIARACGLGRAAARRAGFVLVTAPLFAIYAQLGYTDPLLAALLTAAFACAVRRTTLPEGARRAALLLAAGEGIALAGALLTKGPVALLFALGWRIGAACARRDPAGARAPGAFARLDVAVFGVALAIAGVWLARAWAVAGDAYVAALLPGQLERRIGGSDPQHAVWPGFALGVVLLGGVPWSVYGLAALRRRPEAGSWRPPPQLAALLGAGVLPCLLIALMPTQQPHYVLPALPPLALLAGELLAAPVSRAARRIAGGVGGAVAALLVAATAALQWPRARFPRVEGDVLAGIASDLPLVAGLAFAGASALVLMLRRGAPPATGVDGRSVAVTVALLVAVTVACDRLDRWFSARDLLAAPAVREATRIVAPTGARSSLRLVTRLPRVEEFERRDARRLLLDDPELLVVVWEDELAEKGLDGAASIVARGHLRGRPLVALRAAP